jgi:hypothetical protein
MTAWLYDSPQLDGDDQVYRKVLDRPKMSTFDEEQKIWRIHPAAFRRDAYDGASVHLDSVLVARDRDVMTIYPQRYGFVRLLIKVVRSHELGVLAIDDAAEPDEDLRAAHCEIRPPMPEKNRPAWNAKINEICLCCDWMRVPQMRHEESR